MFGLSVAFFEARNDIREHCVSRIGGYSLDKMSRRAGKVAVLVPCHNEEGSVARVVHDFRAVLPSADIYVFDNRSSDQTAQRAREAGAIVRSEARPGKGSVVRRMFADVDADVYVLVDGDATYDAGVAPGMIKLLLDQNLDMVIGKREALEGEDEAYPRGHRLGNRFFNRMLRVLFGSDFTDVFSGYRVMTRRFVKSFPARSSGFEVETEIAAHATDIDAPCAEVVTHYRARAGHSESKLRTYRDGFRILTTGIWLFKEMRPFRFFGVVALLLTCAAIGLAIPLFVEYAETGLVPRLPTAVLAAATQIVALIFLICGIVLDSVCQLRRDAKRLTYLGIPRAPR
jgi:glycosyltransferase involved in cell wall biosynthesis